MLRFIQGMAMLSLLLGIASGCQQQEQARPVDPDQPSGFGNAQSPMAGQASTGNPTNAPTLIDGDELDSGVDFATAADAANLDEEADSAQFEIIPFAVETRVGERRTPAGLENRITCQVLDQVGEPILDLQSEAEIHPDIGFERFERIEPVFGAGGAPALGGFQADEFGGQPVGGNAGGAIALPEGLPLGGIAVEERKLSGAIGLVARDYEVACAAPALGLRDPSPAVWTVVPAAAHRVTTALDKDQIETGESVTVTCASFDKYGNRRDDNEFDIDVTPQPRELTRRGNEIQIEGAGRFDVRCVLAGAEEFNSAAVEIKSGLPSQLTVSLFPDRPVYRTGSVIELIPQVTDSSGNVVSAVTLEFFSEPELPSFGEGRFQANTPGEYQVGVRVTSPTENDVVLEADKKIIVAFDGPGIDCTEPEMGQVIVRAPGQMKTLVGRVTQVNDLRSVTVDGQPVVLDGDGRWRVQRPVTWGLNLFDVVVESESDGTFRTFCAFYAAQRFDDGDSPTRDALLLQLRQDAFDDGEPNRPLRSIGDTLRRVINSPGLAQTVDQAASAQNPIVPNECRARVFGACIFRLGVDYLGYENRGPNDIRINLEQGGLRVRVAFKDQHVRAKFKGTLGNTVRVRASEIVVDITFDVQLRGNGQPDVSMRSLNHVSVGRLSADFSGLLGFVFELVFNAFRGLIERTVTDALRDFLRDNVDRVLTDLFGNIQIGELSQGFVVPALSGGAPVPLIINADLSRMDFNPQRVLFGLDARVDGPNIIGDRGFGIPRLPNDEGVSIPDDRSAGAAVRLSLLNQVLYRLWRANYFDAQTDGLIDSIADRLPNEVEAELRLTQYPWVSGVDGENRLQIYVGPMSASVTPRGSMPIRLEAAAIISASVSLRDGNDLVFEGVRIDRLALNFFGASYVLPIQEIVEQTLSAMLQGIIDRALNDGLPSLPLPEFVIPNGLGQFDLPAGTRIGLRQPRLNGLIPAWMLDGNLGE